MLLALLLAAVSAALGGEVRRVGVINWDAALPTNTFFGSHVARSLGPEKFRNRTPYFATAVAPDAIDFPVRTAEDYDREFRHAIDAGIDYFAYCWYDACPPAKSIVKGKAARADGHLDELTRTRRFHLRSALRDRLSLCAILVTAHPYSDPTLLELALTMREPCYEKVGGRPLVYFFMGKLDEPLARLKRFCREAGAGEPYAVFMDNIGDSPKAGFASADALSAYACCSAAADYRSLMDTCLAFNSARAQSGKPVVPFLTVGWDPSPRIERPVPWVGYDAASYAPPASAEELLEGARRMDGWIREHRSACPTGHVLVFAWNEFEEGGWICPTVGKGGAVDRSRLMAFRSVVRELKGQ